MLTYTPGETLVHRLDPRAKIAFQIGFAIAALAASSALQLLAVFAVAVGCLSAARLSPVRALRAYRLVVVFLALGPILGGLTVGAPWFRVDGAVTALWSVARIVPVLLVSAAFVHATPVRDTRAAIQHTVPGRFGQLLGVGVALTFRFVPVVRADVGHIREAIAARGGQRRSWRDRATRLATLSLVRAVGRADSLSVALRARCFAYNPTLPALQFSRADALVVGAALALAASALL
ncbi:energy-coupling factor transporter transmembrane component T family protein [Salinibaculum rarum]|uniref:energy-coupling factor transporter transmembrane component T family protein n=1 Tax=Salinibaculum rarum TaxID=3058903 RepID=UPI00265DA8A6|nr:energy-coupling factor transporter transmembrane component T [Salinibaculum sp. KK48]